MMDFRLCRRSGEPHAGRVGRHAERWLKLRISGIRRGIHSCRRLFCQVTTGLYASFRNGSTDGSRVYGCHTAWVFVALFMCFLFDYSRFLTALLYAPASGRKPFVRRSRFSAMTSCFALREPSVSRVRHHYTPPDAPMHGKKVAHPKKSKIVFSLQ